MYKYKKYTIYLLNHCLSTFYCAKTKRVINKHELALFFLKCLVAVNLHDRIYNSIIYICTYVAVFSIYSRNAPSQSFGYINDKLLLNLEALRTVNTLTTI